MYEMNILKHLVPIKHGLRAAKKSCEGWQKYTLNFGLDSFAAASFSFSRSFHDSSVEAHTQEQEVIIAVGSNVGDRLHNFDEALQQMKKSGIQITKHACLYETEPAYVTTQPRFLNSAIRGITKLQPHELLKVLKQIEKNIGRTDGIRYGPRPIDLDILFYGDHTINTDILTIPHERIQERPFVMAPLVDLLGSDKDDYTLKLENLVSKRFGGLFVMWEKLGGESLIGKDGMERVFPIANELRNFTSRTSIMGILNVTPDSFSDGGKYLSTESAISQARLMLSEGADIIDIGAQSTRPKASKLSAEEELDRLIPVLEAVKNMPEMEGKILSVDTFYSQVAEEAVSNGAHLVNDVSGGQLDSNMHCVVAKLKVPYIVMHMRGDPCTMQNTENLVYDDVCKDVASELYTRVSGAEMLGIPAWRIIIDPGIGFSKNTEQNLDILIRLPVIRSEIGRRSLAVSHAPLLIGPSRKRFLGEVCARPEAAERDAATVAAVTAGVLQDANIVRVHNVKDNRDAVKLCDAMMDRKRCCHFQGEQN